LSFVYQLIQGMRDDERQPIWLETRNGKIERATWLETRNDEDEPTARLERPDAEKNFKKLFYLSLRDVSIHIY